MNVKIDNLNINYIKKGEGKTVLIVPGWGTVINTYRPLIESISTYANVICLDMPGFGESTEPEESWNIDEFVDFTIKFIKSQKIKELDVIGHSNGGKIIIKMSNRKDLDFKINKIVLIGSSGIVNKKPLKLRIKTRIYKICKTIVQTKLMKKLFPDLLNRLKNYFGSADYKNASPIMRESMVKVVNEDVRDCLPNIKVPTLLIWGENDTATPIKDGELMDKLIPDSGLIRVKDCTHYVFLENPNFVNLVISNFLNGGKNGNNN